MKTFLKVLVILLFLASIAALTFGVMLFMKRELLKGRTQRLEKAIKEFDAVIEAEAPVMEPLPKDVEIDLSPCNDEIPETLDFNTFWTTYKYSLELQSEIMISTSSRNRELMSYFVMDAAGNKHLLLRVKVVYPPDFCLHVRVGGACKEVVFCIAIYFYLFSLCPHRFYPVSVFFHNHAEGIKILQDLTEKRPQPQISINGSRGYSAIDQDGPDSHAVGLKKP